MSTNACYRVAIITQKTLSRTANSPCPAVSPLARAKTITLLAAKSTTQSTEVNGPPKPAIGYVHMKRVRTAISKITHIEVKKTEATLAPCALINSPLRVSRELQGSRVEFFASTIHTLHVGSSCAETLGRGAGNSVSSSSLRGFLRLHACALYTRRMHENEMWAATCCPRP